MCPAAAGRPTRAPVKGLFQAEFRGFDVGRAVFGLSRRFNCSHQLAVLMLAQPRVEVVLGRLENALQIVLSMPEIE